MHGGHRTAVGRQTDDDHAQTGLPPLKRGALWQQKQLLLQCTLLLHTVSLLLLLLPRRTQGGLVCVTTDDVDGLPADRCQGNTRCGDALYPSLIRRALDAAPPDAHGILAVGSFEADSSARAALEHWVALAGNSASSITYLTNGTDMSSYNLSSYKLLYISSDRAVGGMNHGLQDALMAFAPGITRFVHVRGGSLIVLGQTAFPARAYGFLPGPLSFTAMEFGDVTVTSDMKLYAPAANDTNLDHKNWRGYFTGPVDWSGLRVVAHQAGRCPVTSGPYQDCRAAVLCNMFAVLTVEGCCVGREEDGDGLVNSVDPGCLRCGDGKLLYGDEWSPTGVSARAESLTPPVLAPPPSSQPPSGPPASAHFPGRRLAATATVSPIRLPPPSPVAGPRPVQLPSPVARPRGLTSPPQRTGPAASSSPVHQLSNIRTVGQYVKALLTFQGTSQYAGCDAAKARKLTSQLASLVDLAPANVTVLCQPPDSPVYNVSLKVDPTVLMPYFKQGLYDALNSGSLSGLEPLGPYDSNWATTGITVTRPHTFMSPACSRLAKRAFALMIAVMALAGLVVCCCTTAAIGACVAARGRHRKSMGGLPSKADAYIQEVSPEPASIQSLLPNSHEPVLRRKRRSYYSRRSGANSYALSRYGKSSAAGSSIIGIGGGAGAPTIRSSYAPGSEDRFSSRSTASSVVSIGWRGPAASCQQQQQQQSQGSSRGPSIQASYSTRVPAMQASYSSRATEMRYSYSSAARL